MKDINPGSEGSNPFSLVNYKSKLFFGAYDGVNFSFWGSDGSEAGTTIVKDIVPGYYDYYEQPWDRTYGIFEGRVFFTALNVATHEIALWKSNGKTSGY